MKKTYIVPKFEIRDKKHLRQCANCGRYIFTDTICPKCRDILERAFGEDVKKII